MSERLKNIRRMIRQILRGCGTLPHVGEHPGTMSLFMMIAIGALVGASKQGAITAAGGAALMAIFTIPLYLYGAYGRAEDSDHLELADKSVNGVKQ